MTKAALIMNPKAGNGQWADNLNVLKEKLETAYDSVQVYKTKKPGHGAEIVKEIGESIDVLIGFGGDGTIYELINAIGPLDKRPVFAIIPGGTANDFSRAVNMAQDPMEALDQILEGKTEQVDVGYDGGKQYFLNFWGIGLMTQVSENNETEQKNSLGKMSYYMSAVKTVREAEKFHVSIQSDVRDFEGEAVMVIVGNGPFTGGMQAFFPKNNLQDGLFDVIILTSTTISAFWSILKSSIAKEELFNKEEVVHFQTSSLSISCEPNQKIDCDGEKNAETPSELKVLPNHVTMIVGQPF